jgi:two-component system cell cycle sensor histidine kinase/response regulator CckA
MNEKILLIDDEEWVLDIQKQWLEKFEYKVTPFRSSVDALKHYKNNFFNYDIIVSDLGMKDLNGIEFFQETVKIRILPFILVTGFLAKEDERRYLGLGISDIFYKPYDFAEIDKTIKHILNN